VFRTRERHQKELLGLSRVSLELREYGKHNVDWFAGTTIIGSNHSINNVGGRRSPGIDI
jgi:hypothetical protein